MPFIALSEAAAAVVPPTTLGAPNTSIGETLDTMRTQLNTELGARADVVTADLTRWVNYGYRDVAAMLTTQEMARSLSFSLTADQPLYKLPIQVANIHHAAVQDTTTYPYQGGRELEKIDRDTYRKLDDYDSDEPRAFFRQGRLLVLYPTPSNARTLVVDFHLRPDALVNNDDSPLLPQEFHVAIVLRAKWHALRSLMMYVDAAQANNDFLAAIRPLVNTDAEERAGQRAHVSPARATRDMYRRRR